MLRRFLRSLESMLRASPNEVELSVMMFVYQLAVVSSFIVGRATRDTLYLRRMSPETLPLMYTATAVSVALFGYAYSRRADRHRRDVLCQVVLASSGALTFAFWALLHWDPKLWILYPGLYVAVEIIGSITVIQVWTLANDIFTSRQARRLFGVVGAGGVSANIAVGFIIGGLSWVVGPANLLLVNVGLFLATTVLVGRIGQKADAQLRDALERPRRTSRMAPPSRDPHLRSVAGLVLITFAVVTLVDYQFKIVARETFTSERALGSFFGYFYGFAGIAASLVQFFLTNRIVQQAGILVGLSILPASILMGVFSWLVAPLSIVAVSLMRAAEHIFRYTVYDTSLQLLYVPVAAFRRGRAKAFIDGVLKPGAIGLTGLLLVVGGLVAAPVALAKSTLWVDAALILVWFAAVWRVRKTYVGALVEAIQTNSLEIATTVDLVDDDAKSLLRDQLKKGSPQQIIHVLELLRDVSVDWTDELLELLTHEDRAIRTAALQQLERSRRIEARAAVRSLIDDPYPEVRAAAVRAFCTLDRTRGRAAALDRLQDPTLEVRAAAVVALAQHGDFQSMSRAARTLEDLMQSPREAERAAGAEIVAEVKWADFQSSIMRLMNDRAVRVRRAAILAAGRLGSTEALLPLVYKLVHHDTAGATNQSLVRMGEKAEPVLRKVLANPQEDLRIRRRIPAVLVLSGSELALSALIEQTRTRDPELRSAAARAASRLRERNPDWAINRHVVHEVLGAEIDAAHTDELLATAVSRYQNEIHPVCGLLAASLHDRLGRRIRILGDLLTVMAPGVGIRTAWVGLRSKTPSIRSHAVELLDNLLSDQELRRVLPLVEGVRSPTPSAVPWNSYEELQRRLLEESDPWIVACALQWVAETKTAALRPRVAGFLSFPDPVVREAAIRTLGAIGLGTTPLEPEAMNSLRRLQSDPDPRVRSTFLLARRQLDIGA